MDDLSRFEKEFRMILVRFLLGVVIGFFVMEILNPPSVLGLSNAISLIAIAVCGGMLGWMFRKSREEL